MELKIWCKTFLNIYRSLEKITFAIDKIVLTSGLNISGDVYFTANKMIELTNRKITLINLKLLIEKQLSELPSTYAKLLILKYVDRLRGEDIATAFKISNRTYFRRHNAALKSFELCLKKNGKDHKTLLEVCKKEAWIMDLYNKFLEQEKNYSKAQSMKTKKDINQEVDDKNLINIASNNYKKLNLVSNYA
jgi:hypothetical protein